jgi:hypothetical protein
MGDVYLARDTTLDRDVALKLAAVIMNWAPGTTAPQP